MRVNDTIDKCKHNVLLLVVVSLVVGIAKRWCSHALLSLAGGCWWMLLLLVLLIIMRVFSCCPYCYRD